MICIIPARDFRVSLGLDPAASAESRGIEEHLVLLDLETERFAMIMRFRSAQGKVAEGWAYAVGDKQCQTVQKGSLVPLYGASGFSTVDRATAEAKQVLNLPMVPEDSDKAYFFFTARRVDKKAQDQRTIGLAQCLLKGAASHCYALAAYTTIEKAQAGAASYQAEEDFMFRAEIHDIREDTLVTLRSVGELLNARLTVPGLEEAPLAAQYAGVLAGVPVVVDPVPAFSPHDYPLAVSPSFEDVKTWANKTAQFMRKCHDLTNLRPAVKQYFEKIQRLERAKEPAKLTSSTLCECGKPAVFACVTCKVPACLGCLKNSRCSFCRGE